MRGEDLRDSEHPSGLRRALRGVALTGFMGAGKSTIGAALARRLGWPFVDLDERLSREIGPIAAFVSSAGLPAFRQIEREAALALCDGERRVLSTGGGTILDPEVRAALLERYLVVSLDVPLEIARARVGGDPQRPLWDAQVAKRYEERQEIYRMCPLQIDATQPVADIVEAIVREVGCAP